MNTKKMLPSLVLVCGISLTAGFSLAKQQASPQERMQGPPSIYSPQDLALLKEAREREKQSPEVEPQVQSPEVEPQVQTFSPGIVALAEVANSTCTQLVNSGEIPTEAFAECIAVVYEDTMRRL
jgi:hypothetical protein